MISICLGHEELLGHEERFPFVSANSCPVLLAKPYFNRVCVRLGWPGTEAWVLPLKMSYCKEYRFIDHCEMKSRLYYHSNRSLRFLPDSSLTLILYDEKESFLVSRKIPVESEC